VTAKYDGDSIADTCPLYGVSAPEDAECPYAVWSIPSAMPDWTFKENFEELTMQISVFTKDRSPLPAMALGKTLTELFDECALAVTGYTLIRMSRQPTPPLVDDPDGGWQYITQYRLELQEA